MRCFRCCSCSSRLFLSLSASWTSPTMMLRTCLHAHVQPHSIYCKPSCMDAGKYVSMHARTHAHTCVFAILVFTSCVHNRHTFSLFSKSSLSSVHSRSRSFSSWASASLAPLACTQRHKHTTAASHKQAVTVASALYSSDLGK